MFVVVLALGAACAPGFVRVESLCNNYEHIAEGPLVLDDANALERLRGCTTVEGDVEITFTADDASPLDELVTVDGRLLIRAGRLEQLALDVLEHVGALAVTGLASDEQPPDEASALVSISLPHLRRIEHVGAGQPLGIEIGDLRSLDALHLPGIAVDEHRELSIGLSRLPALRELELPEFSELTFLQLNDVGLESFRAPLLQRVVLGLLVARCTGLDVLELPLLELANSAEQTVGGDVGSVYGLSVQSNPRLGRVEIPSLVTTGDFIFEDNARLSTLAGPALRRAKEFAVRGHEQLQSLDFPLMQAGRVEVSENPALHECVGTAFEESSECAD
jgi:hypothetical protein